MNPFEFLDLPQMQRALVIALLAGPLGGVLGTFITLRGMAFFSDAIAHSALTGLALGYLLNLASDASSPAMQVMLALFCAGVGLFMAWMFEKTGLRADTVMALCFTGSLAFGVIMISRLRGYRVLEGALFGDILASTWADVVAIACIAVLVIFFVFRNLRAWTLLVVNEDLARIEGIPVRGLNYLFVAMTAIVVALLLPHLGAMVISGIIVIPAAAARIVAPHFRGMLVGSGVLGLLGAAAGVISSYHLDTPTGPTIVLADVAILLGGMLVVRLATWWKCRKVQPA
jgi:zinc transport system permease protein